MNAYMTVYWFATGSKGVFLQVYIFSGRDYKKAVDLHNRLTKWAYKIGVL